MSQQVVHGQADVAQGAGLLFDGLAQSGQPIDGLGEILELQAGLVVDLLVDQVDLDALVPGELVVLAVNYLLVPQVREVHILGSCGNCIVQGEQ